MNNTGVALPAILAIIVDIALTRLSTPSGWRTHIGRRGRSGGSTSRQEGLVSIIACSNAQITIAGLVPVGL